MVTRKRKKVVAMSPARLRALKAKNRQPGLHWLTKTSLVLSLLVGLAAIVFILYRVFYVGEDLFVPAPQPGGGTGAPGGGDKGPDGGGTGDGSVDTGGVEGAKGRHWVVLLLIVVTSVVIVFDFLEVAVKRFDPLFFSRFPEVVQSRRFVVKAVELLVAGVMLAVVAFVLVGDGNVSKADLTLVGVLYGVMWLTSMGSALTPRSFNRETKRGEKEVEFWPQIHFGDDLWGKDFVFTDDPHFKHNMAQEAEACYNSQKEHLLRGMRVIDEMLALPKAERKQIRFFVENIIGDKERHKTDRDKHLQKYEKIMGKIIKDATGGELGAFDKEKNRHRALVVYGSGPFLEEYAKQKKVDFKLLQTMDKDRKEWLIHETEQLPGYKRWLKRKLENNPRFTENKDAPLEYDKARHFDRSARQMREAMVVHRIKEDIETHSDAKYILQFGMNHTFSAWNFLNTKVVFRRIWFASESIWNRLVDAIRDRTPDPNLPIREKLKLIISGPDPSPWDIRVHGQLEREPGGVSAGYYNKLVDERNPVGRVR